MVFFMIILFLALSFFNPALAESPILLTSIPKCGTWMLEKCVQLITKKENALFRFHNQGFFRVNWAKTNPYAIQIFEPTVDFLDRCTTLNQNEYMIAHLSYGKPYEELLLNKKCKIIFILRDPRDQLISRIFFTYNNPVPYAGLQHLSFNELLEGYMGVGSQPHQIFDDLLQSHIEYGEKPRGKVFSHITQFYNAFLGWQSSPLCLTVRFEDLVGENGGGSKESQLKVIKAIVKHLDIPLTEKEIQENVVDKLFGGTFSFREGKIGCWKHGFTPEHKELFKQHGGELLIRLGYEKDLNW